MAKEHPKKRHAYLLFVEQGLDAKEISEMLGVSENTISKWNKVEGWKEQRQARTLSPDKLIAYYYEQSELIIQQAKDEKRPINSKEADALNKLASSIQKLDKRIDVSINMSVLRNFNLFLMRVNPGLAGDIAPYQIEYAQQLINAQK